jgi:hypothetical protein
MTKTDVSRQSEAGAESPFSEGIDILSNLRDNIQRHGNYSAESTMMFIDQALQCFRAGDIQTGRLADEHWSA